MIASPIALAASVRLATRLISAALLSLLYGYAGLRRGVAIPSTARCYVAITAVISMPAPYRVIRVVSTGVREYEDDGAGTVAYCEPRDAGPLRTARAAVDRRVVTSRQPAQNVEHVVIRSTSSTVAVQHLVFVAAAARVAPEFAGVEIVALKAPDGTEYQEAALPPLLSTDSARSACTRANATLRQAAASFRWAC